VKIEIRLCESEQIHQALELVCVAGKFQHDVFTKAFTSKAS
jgi:hypothetical protein